ncbi:MAG TPA: IS110 family transposase, partial [Terriglobales bacterium]|nr:IS110 family transposase [Terriglobales bacterium]
AECGHQLWIGDAAAIRASYVRRQKTDRRDAAHLLRLLREQRFPRIWVPTAEERDVRQLLVHRAKRVRMATQIKNQLQALALNQGMRRGRKLWTAAGRQMLQQLSLGPWATRRRDELLASLEELERQIAELDQAVKQEAGRRPQAVRLQTQPGVGPVTALATVLTLGPVERFASARQVASYAGLTPSEHSSGGKQRLGHISKQGSPFLRGLLVEAAQSAARHDPQLRRCYVRLAMRKSKGVAKVAVARKLLMKMYWMLRLGCDAAQLPGSSCR